MITPVPEVRIQYGWLISDAASVALNEKWGDGTPLRTTDEYEAIAAQYQEWWQPFGEDIIRAVSKALQLEFRLNILDVYVAPWFYAISDPLIIGPGFENQDEFIGVLTHELTHRLIADNTKAEYGKNMIEDWKTLFGDQPFTTLTHIPVYAVMKKLYLETLDRPDLLQAEVVSVLGDKEYAKAWAFVERQGYQTVLDMLVMQFEAIGTSSHSL
jgi:hypothetical protein